MAKVNIAKIEILDNPGRFTDPFKFEITFECYEALSDDLEWRLTYVTCSEGSNQTRDNVLDSVCVGPLPEGRHRFVFEADAPAPSGMQPSEMVGVTVALLSCAYLEHEFIKVGYIVANEYEDPEMNENPPETPNVELLRRRIVDEPRVTRVPIKWHRADEGGGGENAAGRPQSAADGEQPVAAAAAAQTPQGDGKQPTAAAGAMEAAESGPPLHDLTNSALQQQQAAEGAGVV